MIKVKKVNWNSELTMVIMDVNEGDMKMIFQVNQQVDKKVDIDKGFTNYFHILQNKIKTTELLFNEKGLNLLFTEHI